MIRENTNLTNRPGSIRSTHPDHFKEIIKNEQTKNFKETYNRNNITVNKYREAIMKSRYRYSQKDFNMNDAVSNVNDLFPESSSKEAEVKPTCPLKLTHYRPMSHLRINQVVGFY